MKKITISDTIKLASPSIKLGILEADITMEAKNDKLWQLIIAESLKIKNLSTESIKQIPQIASTRETYKKLGKEPSRYRPSAEALLRRIIKGKPMYQISNAVDAVNYFSIKTGYSTGGYDTEKIAGDILFDRGDNSEYKAIGRGLFNIEGLPAFFDEKGPFGTPTSDSERTSITNQTTKITLIVMNFGGHDNFSNDMDFFSNLIKNYCNGQNIKVLIK